MKSIVFIFLQIIVLITVGCKQKKVAENQVAKSGDKFPTDAVTCHSSIPKRFAAATGAEAIQSSGKGFSKQGMVKVVGGSFMMGGDNEQAVEDEYPKHKVTVNAFYMDKYEVTNGQFRKFVEATHYKTIAERVPDWEELKNSCLQVRKNLPQKPWSQPVWYLLRLKPLLILMIIVVGGAGCQELIGAILPDQLATLRVKIIILLRRFVGMMLRLMQHGLEKGFLLKQSGNGQLEAVYQMQFIHGEMSPLTKANPKPIFGRVTSQI